MKRAGTVLAATAAALIAWSLAGRAQTAAEGQQLFERRCAGCHSLERDKEGPRLGGVYGRAAGSVKSFDYSEAFKNAGITWNAETLDRWLTDPEKLIPANDMNFRVSDRVERQAIIAYLQHRGR
ncbi:MAG TPA: c-type cytochrome [Bryobacteraceae bacterium]|nr:c-type cytochrome [Bryobacteraceae bacterium]